jgi:pyrimidine nucleoside transport protein
MQFNKMDLSNENLTKKSEKDKIHTEDDDVTSTISEPDFDSTLDDLENNPNNPITKFLELIRYRVGNSLSENAIVKKIIVILLFILYNAFLITAIAYHVRNETDFGWCTGLGFLIITTGIVYLFLIYYHVLKAYGKEWFSINVSSPFVSNVQPSLSQWYIQLIFGLVLIAGLITFLILDTKDNRRRLISTLGLFVLVLIGVVLSKHPGRIRWRHVFWGMGLQFGFGLIILRWNTGRNILQCISDKVTTFLQFSDAGSGFVYGYLASGFKYTQVLDSGEKIEFELPGAFAFGVRTIT